MRLAKPDLETVAAEALEHLRAAIAIRSENPPGDEQAMAEYLRDELLRLGATVELQEVLPGRPNVLGRFRFGPGPVLMLTAHIDTVPVTPGAKRDLFSAALEDGRLYGRGACDDKGPLIAMLAACGVAATRLAEELGGTLLFAGVMGEESGGEGTAFLAKHGPLPDWAIVGEPTELKPVLGHKGSYRKRFTFRGKAAHSSDPSKGVNAVYRAARFVLQVEAWNERLQAVRHPLFGSPVASANVVHGGNKVIVIPDECHVEVDRRLLPGESEATVGEEVETILAGLRENDPDLEVEITDLGMGKVPAELPAEHPLARTVKSAVESVTGQATVFEGYRAGTDMTFLTAAGVPTLIFGPGSLDQAHTVDEYVPVEEFGASIAVYTEVIRDLLGRTHDV